MSEDQKSVSKDTFEFRKARIVYGNKGTGVEIMGRLGGPDYENGRHWKFVWL